jgi:hypothetical protein
VLVLQVKVMLAAQVKVNMAHIMAAAAAVLAKLAWQVLQRVRVETAFLAQLAAWQLIMAAAAPALR